MFAHLEMNAEHPSSPAVLHSLPRHVCVPWPRPADTENVSKGASSLAVLGVTLQNCLPQVLSNDAVTGAVDLWALGCIIFQMLIGKAPFKVWMAGRLLCRHLLLPNLIWRWLYYERTDRSKARHDAASTCADLAQSKMKSTNPMT